MRSAEPIFAVENLRIVREAVVINNISWSVARGEHWVILGANGSGKTSLLSALTGYLLPTSGVVRIGPAHFGASDWREVRARVGLVSSTLSHQIEPRQTAREVIFSGRDAQINFWGRPSAAEAQRATSILRQVRATHLAGRCWCHLSQGERQRILIGRALMASLKMLFLDEPCAGLDPVAREDFLGFLEKLARQKNAPSLVLVTHHVEEIVPLFSHALLLSRGTVLACGTKKQVLTSRNLSRTFGSPVRLRHARNRYRLDVAAGGASFSA